MSKKYLEYEKPRALGLFLNEGESNAEGIAINTRVQACIGCDACACDACVCDCAVCGG